MTSSAAPLLISVILPLVALAIALTLTFYIVRAAVISALQRARREAWTEQHMPEMATWLSERRRRALAELNQRPTPPADSGNGDGGTARL